MLARLLFILAALFMAGCSGSVNILPEPFTRERADGKIPVKTELIRQQVRAELTGMPEGEAEVVRWQKIEADYHACRLSSGKAEKAAEQVFADCMANRGYVYMYPLDAEQLHNDIAFEMEKDPEKWKAEVVTATIAASPITITNTPPPVADSGSYAKYLLGIAAIGGIAAAVGGGGGGGDGGNAATTPTSPQTTSRVSIRIEPQAVMITRATMAITTTIRNHYISCIDQFCQAWTRRLRSTVVTVSSQTVVVMERITCNTQVCRGQAIRILSDITLSPIITTTRITTFTTITIALGANAALNTANQISYSPDMRRVVHAAMADSFNRGLSFGESGFAFSGRYDGDNRAAGFSYDFGGLKMRTDYVRLPAKQDNAVWLDTYRFGIVPRINDEMAAFAGVDNYNNAIIALDITGDNLHRFGIAYGDGYAVKYELRLNL